jgi:hypothetical protein
VRAAGELVENAAHPAHQFQYNGLFIEDWNRNGKPERTGHTKCLPYQRQLEESRPRISTAYLRRLSVLENSRTVAQEQQAQQAPQRLKKGLNGV